MPTLMLDQKIERSEILQSLGEGEQSQLAPEILTQLMMKTNHDRKFLKKTM
jgi:hypothetical protein